jgi:predicted esterase
LELALISHIITGAFRKAFSDVEFLFIDAPTVLKTNEHGVEELTWWQSSENGKVYERVDEGVAHVEEFIQKNAPIDGIIAFSQGAAFGALLCARSRDAKLPFKFAVLASGFVPRAESLQSEVGADAPKISKPVLIVVGKADEMVAPEKTMAMANQFANAEILEHERGHVLDHSKQTTSAIASFIDKFRES